MSELRGIGLDICGIARMAQQLDNTHFLQRILTKEEIAYLRSRGASAADTLAGLYAAVKLFLSVPEGSHRQGARLRHCLPADGDCHFAHGAGAADGGALRRRGIALSRASAADDYARRGGRGGICALFGMKESLLMR